MSLSTIVVPLLLDTATEPGLLLRQWVRLYHYGHIYMPAVCVATCGLYGYCILRSPSRVAEDQLRRRMYAVAGAVTFGMVPFTWAMMAPTNDVLFGLEASASASALASAEVEVEAGVEVADLRTVQALLVKWAWLHLVRALFPLVGAIVGFALVLWEASGEREGKGGKVGRIGVVTTSGSD